MKLHELSPAKGSTHAPKRIGRGPGSGTGKTAGRGEKGQKSRSGHTLRPGFEGGQMPLVRRVPKRGFTNIFRTEYAVVNVGALADFAGEGSADAGEAGDAGNPGKRLTAVNPDLLAERGLVRAGRPLKVLAGGEIATPLKVTAHRFSKAARAKIEAAGGSCEELEQ
jgi:large subunit ribosomal protein L15